MKYFLDSSRPLTGKVSRVYVSLTFQLQPVLVM